MRHTGLYLRVCVLGSLDILAQMPACIQGNHEGMLEGWLPPVVDNVTATCVWEFVLL
jgi:hypothetical protein